MLVRKILEFINDLKEIRELSPDDMLLIESLEEKFKHCASRQQLNADNIQFLMNCFELRSQQVEVGFENDYMLNTGLANQKWIQLAKDIAPLTQKKYVQVLLPKITNSVDFNNLSLLTETERPENFYLGNDNRTLYRKRGLCEHLTTNGFILSTHRYLRTNILSAMSIKELTRLQSCKQLNGGFSIGEEQFTNFWNFLQKKVFTKLQSKGEMPLDLLPHLLSLIDKYYELKTKGSDFKLFKQAAQDFFIQLDKYCLDEINFFYGVEISFKEKKLYLLDFLIVINKVENYVLDEHFSALAEWLFKFNSVLKSKHTELYPFYNQVDRNNLNEGHPGARRDSAQEYSLNQCLTMLLSLFTLEFDYLPLTGHTISFWDMTNPVFSEGKKIFSMFKPLLVSNMIDQLVPQYRSFIEEYIVPARAEQSLYILLTRYDSVNDWYRHVDNSTLFKRGVIWFQPELLMHVLLRVRAHVPAIVIQIDKFLDELIHTCAQDNYDLLKQFRVNILFSNFKKKLPEQEQEYLIILLQLYEHRDTHTFFLSNCIDYIVNRLSNISSFRTGGSIQFFSAVRKIDCSKIVFSPMSYENLNEIIDLIKGRLQSPELNLDEDLLEKMIIYLRTLSRPILSIEELQEDISRARTGDYLGAPT
ncbi:hypothetical protein TUM19329_32110 [Legionella antarctica]|uniref:Uncharacterized protein n=1 Tax=Legionella antarctica TaxID=2708020 RepID=A0A6F8T9K9_9GAMM|nr:hypothetical protein [Legionella antarctica]BCA96850.1 hypothetical protein TUM19329_32110 [Legionella antarctica]